MKTWHIMVAWAMLIAAMLTGYTLLMSAISNDHDQLVREQTIQEVCK